MKRRLFIMLCCMAAVFGYYSCENKERKIDDGGPHNPEQSITIESIDPVEGMRATQLLLRGSNLGNDPASVEVYFGDRKANIVGCASGRVLLYVPRLEEGEHVVTVKIGDQSVEMDQRFTYHITALVSTVVGNPNTGTQEFKAGAFSEAILRDPRYLTVDNEGNLFLSHWTQRSMVLIDQQTQTVTRLLEITGSSDDPAPTAPTTDASGRIILAPANGGGAAYREAFYEFDPDAGWAARTRSIFKPAQSSPDYFTLDAYKHSFAICPLDGKVYYRSNRDGAVIRFDPETRNGERARTLDPDETGEHPVLWLVQAQNGDSFCVFDPNNPEMLYAALGGGTGNPHGIVFCNIRTGENGWLTGGTGSEANAWRDGPLATAKFNSPRQMVLDSDGNLVVADRDNHCIRKIDLHTGLVSTLAGIAGKAGFVDGNPDDALFRQPWGLCIDRRDGAMYVADTGNRCIRKLTIE
ncbi:MAG: IPT/TIG domain-containing protein [Bacteroidales bacterium]|nr:IPT/TIG domain-containing protein [Bacteroidales bacterium]